MDNITGSGEIPSDWRSLHDLDRERGWSKGQAFRAFKTIASTLQEGADYRVFSIESHAELLAQWRSRGRLHASSLRLIVLSPAAVARLHA